MYNKVNNAEVYSFYGLSTLLLSVSPRRSTFDSRDIKAYRSRNGTPPLGSYFFLFFFLFIFLPPILFVHKINLCVMRCELLEMYIKNVYNAVLSALAAGCRAMYKMEQESNVYTYRRAGQTNNIEPFILSRSFRLCGLSAVTNIHEDLWMIWILYGLITHY